MNTDNVPLNVSDDFNQWLTKTRKFWGVPSISVIGPVILLLVNNSPRVPYFPLSAALLWFQVLAITVFLVAIPDPNSNRRIERRASIAVEQFYEAWKKLWLFWLILYGGLAIQESIRLHILTDWFKSDVAATEQFLKASWQWSLGLVGENLLNNLQTLALVMCYLVVSKKTVPEGRETAPLPWLKGAGILVTLMLLEGALTLWGTSLFKSPLSDVPEAFRWLSGLSAGVAIALLLGKLDSRAIGLPIWVVCLTYLYAVIQPGWAAFPKQPDAKIILVVAALILKTLMFLLVAWLLKSGVLLFYMARLKGVDERVDHQRRTFLSRLQASKTKNDRTKPTEESPSADGSGIECETSAHRDSRSPTHAP